jgi:hypothetical protein
MLSSFLILFSKDFIMNKIVVSLLAFTAGALAMATAVGYTHAGRKAQKDYIRKQCNKAAGATLEECGDELNVLHTCATVFMSTHYHSQTEARERLYNLGSRIDELKFKIKPLAVDPDAPGPTREELDVERTAIIDAIENIILDQ